MDGKPSSIEEIAALMNVSVEEAQRQVDAQLARERAVDKMKTFGQIYGTEAMNRAAPAAKRGEHSNPEDQSHYGTIPAGPVIRPNRAQRRGNKENKTSRGRWIK